MPAQRLAALVVSVVAGACVTLAGCGGNPSGSSGSGTSVSGGVNIPASSTSPSASATSGSGKLTGDFCNDFKNIGEHVKVPANVTGSLSELRQNGVPALNTVAAYFDALAGEAPAKAGQELRVIAADYRALAASITSGNTNSLSKVVSQMENLTTNGASGTAFRQLIAYMATKCLTA
jgi:hypothetical protein